MGRARAQHHKEHFLRIPVGFLRVPWVLLRVPWDALRVPWDAPRIVDKYGFPHGARWDDVGIVFIDFRRSRNFTAASPETINYPGSQNQI